jgi:D-alanyl-D-alanine carboxypeptidase/D-alanyl-D-alanine-endopeptidase (penicillin-binding protein 4)
MKRKFALILLLALLMLYGCAPKVTVAVPKPAAPVLHSWQEVRSQLDRVFADPLFSNAHWGVMLQSLDSGEIIYQLNSGKLFMPASNMKLLTSAAALLRLGEDYLYRTRLLALGSIEAGVLKGSLVVEGSGDPTISDRYSEKDATRAFRQWVAQLKEKGLQRIDGDIIGDDDAFDDVGLGGGWAWDYLSAGYAAECGALQFNENVIQLRIQPGEAQDRPATIQLRPKTQFPEIVNQLKTVAAGGETDISVDRTPMTNRIIVSGQIRVGALETVRTVSIHNPTKYFAQVLREVLEEEGIAVTGRAVDIDDLSPKPVTSGAQVLHIHESPPLKNILTVLLKESQNLFAETLVKTLGKEGRAQGTFEAGRGIVQETLERMAIPRESYIMADGSGLSRYDYVTPELLVRIIRGMYRRKEFQTFYDALPIAGADGTIRSRMQGTKAQNNVHAKTGSIANVRSLTGYVKTADGEMLGFSILANNFNVSSRQVEYDQDLVLEMLANFSRKR